MTDGGLEKIVQYVLTNHPDASDIQFVGGDVVWLHENGQEKRLTVRDQNTGQAVHLPLSNDQVLHWADVYAEERGGRKELADGERGTVERACDVAGARLRMTWRRQLGGFALNTRILPSSPPALTSARFAKNPVPNPLVRLVLENTDGVILFEGPTGSGKALTLTTPIPTPDGFTNMGDLKVGDTVFGRDGKPCQVTALSDILQTPKLFRLRFSDGQEITADEGHQWLVYAGEGTEVDRATLRRLTEYASDMSTVESSLVGVARKRATLGDVWAYLVRNRLNGPWMNEAGLRESLYMVDCLPDESGMYSLSEALQGLARRLNERHWNSDGTLVRMSTGELLAQGGQFAVPVSGALELPESEGADALRGSQAQRTQALFGLWRDNPLLEFSSRKQADDAANLLRSLGFVAEVVDMGGSYRVRRLFSDRISIESIESVASEPARCISVDSDDHTYLAGEGYIVTSNSTLLAGLVNEVNQTQHRHIYTIEDPVEFVHRSQKSLITQREVHTDVSSFHQGMLTAKRSKPGIILLGELRDRDIMRAALESAGEGHLVLATSHASSVPEALTSFVGSFPSDEQNEVAQRLAVSLRGVIAQKLVPGMDGKMVPARELLVAESTVASKIRDGDIANGVKAYLASSATAKMTDSFSKDDDLYRLVAEGLISRDTARMYASDPDSIVKRIIQTKAGGAQ